MSEHEIHVQLAVLGQRLREFERRLENMENTVRWGVRLLATTAVSAIVSIVLHFA